MNASMTISDAYPDILKYIPDFDILWNISSRRRNFIKNSIASILDSNPGQPFLRRDIFRFLKLESLNSEKEDKPVLSHHLIELLKNIAKTIKDHRNSSFKQHLKLTGNNLPNRHINMGDKLSKIVLPLYADAKNPQFTCNTELQQFVHQGRFKHELAIDCYKARVEAMLNVQDMYDADLIPVVFTSDKFFVTDVHYINADLFQKARSYYLKELLAFHFKKFFARMEIGVKDTFSNERGKETSAVFHIHALVNKDEYAEFLKHAKIERSKARKRNMVNNSYLRLKFRRLTKKCEQQSHLDYVQRQLAYSLKFSTLEGMDNSDYYRPKTTRLEFAQQFQSKHSLLITKFLLPRYSQSLLYRRNKWLTVYQLEKRFAKRVMWNKITLYVNMLTKMHKKLDDILPKPKPIEPELTKVVIPNSPVTEHDTVTEVKPKKDAVTFKLYASLWRSSLSKVKKFFDITGPTGTKPPD